MCCWMLYTDPQSVYKVLFPSSNKPNSYFLIYHQDSPQLVRFIEGILYSKSHMNKSCLKYESGDTLIPYKNLLIVLPSDPASTWNNNITYISFVRQYFTFSNNHSIMNIPHISWLQSLGQGSIPEWEYLLNNLHNEIELNYILIKNQLLYF